jgi:hypothetical protein
MEIVYINFLKSDCFMGENDGDLKTNQPDSMQTSLVRLIESEAEEMLSDGQNPHAKRIHDACDKPFRWGSAARGRLTAERRGRLNAMSLDEVYAALT